MAGVPRFSSRTPADLAPNRLAAALAARRAAGAPLCDLTESNPTAVGIPYPEAEILASLADPGALRYAPAPLGLPSARAAVADHLRGRGLAVDPERVVLTASSSESYAYLLKLLCDPGDAILVPRPSYPLFDHLAALEGVAARAYPLAASRGWALDVDAVEVELDDRARAVVVVSPNNPTGSIVSAAALAELAELAAARGLAIVSDEVFADYAAGGGRAPSVLGTAGALSFALGGLSKAAGLPQLKLGWMVVGGPADAAAAALARLELIADTYLSVATPVQLALPRLLALAGGVQAAIAARVGGGRQRLAALLAGSPARLLPADGGWYGLVELPAATDEEALALALLDDGVVVHPGWFFDLERPAVVLSLLARSDDLAAGAAALLRRLG